MSTIFDAAYVTALAVSSPYLLPKLLLSNRFRTGLAQRLGHIGNRKEKRPCVWIHCASVGEVITVKTLVNSLEKEFNNWDVVISTNTTTGQGVARKYFPRKVIFYFPLDISWVVERSLDAIRPDCVILAELEIWPNFLMALARRRVPVALLNARISEKSMRWYRVLNKISRGFFESLTKKENVFCARTKADAVRLKAIGIADEQIFVTGNMKYDNIVTSVLEDIKARLLHLFGIKKEEKIFVCGSTHEGEEAIILRIFKRISSQYPNLRLALAPRHIERCNDVVRLIESMGLKVARKTLLDKGLFPVTAEEQGRLPSQTVILVDTLGELQTIYSIADYVFVGRSLVPQGGQNMMEPAGLAKPVIIGPHTFNFHEEVPLLRNANAIKIVQDETSFFDSLTYLLEHQDEALEMGKRAQLVVEEQRGATERNLNVLRKTLLKERIVSV
ncbi:MAG: kdtA [Candidatus Brocadiaceae bacterium]|nr:kdtA [Candidatus Brocadiaceae bacterium]